MKVGIVQFLGTNCDRDCKFACDVLDLKSEFLWYESKDLKGCDVIVLPGGFSYGDYLRAGVLAKFSPIMESIREFAKRGGYVIGICNGFQILTESGLLKGTLLKNNNLRFVHKDVYVKVEKSKAFFTNGLEESVLKLPIAHADGNYYCSKEDLDYMLEKEMVVLRYSNSNGQIEESCNPNGSLDNIAGVCNEEGNVFGLMPHPERAVGDLGSDGESIWSRLL